MLSYLIIVTLLNFKIISGVGNDDTFINSLPEKQKEEFLRKVEERIQNEVPEAKFPKGNDTDVDLYEKRLEDQGKSIRDILRTEIDSLKRRSINDTLIKSELRANDNHETNSHIDLTMRRQKVDENAALTQMESKRQPRKASLPEDENKNNDEKQIPVAVAYDKNIGKEKRNLTITSREVFDNSKLTNNKSKVDEIKWENISLVTKAVNVNTSSIDLNKTGRRSDNIDTIVKNSHDKKLKNNNVKRAEAVNETASDSISAASYDINKSKSQEDVNVKAGDVNTSSIDLNKTGRRSDKIGIIVKNVDDKNLKKYNVKSVDAINSTSTTNNDFVSYDSNSQENVYTKAVSVNTSSIEHNKTVRPSDNINTIVNKNQYKNLEKYNIKSAETVNDTSLHSIVAASYDINKSKSQENDNITKNANHGNSKNNDKDSSQLESVHETSSAITTQYNASSKTGDVNLSKVAVDINTTVSNVDDSPHELVTMTNNVNSITTPNDNEAAIGKVPEPNKQSIDNEDNENQPHYVPVYNYDPKNAYFNAYNYQGPSGNADGETRNHTTNIEIDTHAKSTNVNFYSLSPSNTITNLRIKNVKENDFASNTKIGVHSDLPDVVFKDSFSNLFNGRIKPIDIGSSESDIPYEKPLKHSLNKIRKILFMQNIALDKSKDERSDPNNNKRENDDNMLKERFDTFPFTENKNKSNEDELNSDDEVYNNVIRSLKKHNKKIQNEDINQIIMTLEKIQSKNKKKSKHRIPKYYQSRFQVKNRDESKPTLNSIEEDIRNEPFTIIDEAKYEKGNIKKNTNFKIYDKYIEIHASILKDLVVQNDVGLEKYDWLGTTVKIQAAIAKLQVIIEKKKNRDKLHYLDHRLLEIIVKLHKSAVEAFIERENVENEHVPIVPTSRSLSFPIPRPKNAKSFNTLQRIFGNNRVTRRLFRNDIETFDRALDCLRSCLNDLHTAIKQISLITTFKNQHWFQNLKQLYLKYGTEKEYLEVLLHLVSAKLIGLLEKTAKTIIEEDENLLKENRAMYEIIEIEFVTLIKICNELLRLNN